MQQLIAVIGHLTFCAQVRDYMERWRIIFPQLSAHAMREGFERIVYSRHSELTYDSDLKTRHELCHVDSQLLPGDSCSFSSDILRSPNKETSYNQKPTT